MVWRVWGLSLGLLLLPFLAADGAKAESATIEGVQGWEYEVGSYAWAIWVDGDVSANDLEFDVYATPGDLIDAAKFGLTTTFEARKDRFTFYADILYADFGMDGDVVGEIDLPADLTLQANAAAYLDYRFGVYQAGALYEVYDLPSAYGDTKISFGGGARWVRQEADLGISLGISTNRSLASWLDRIETRINRIEDRQERTETLAQLNTLRDRLLNRRISRASSKDAQQRAERLENRLSRVDRRGQALAAIEAVQDFRLALLQRQLVLSNGGGDGNYAFATTGVMQWVDPVIATRVSHEFKDGEAVTFTGDIGGFNADRNLSWQVQLTYDREGTLFGFDTTSSIGYRALGLLYDDRDFGGSRGVDVVLHGPVAEIAFRW
ncbi:hypothetical protein A7A08_02563 [Methyloligella halotolerans]|uniref:Uncharacterized protein n=1 Tax=Methyloligella halotolerans TaxID=1177755 RepID=A0A1E2RW48_9HYPH|nr:hypothetical protein [Methyloligella halotolerans]ODA66441.1 hypothetical protein A7A08_02563 [Methyloligella halotolerans]